MLILQLKKRIEILEAKVQEQDQKINEILNKLSERATTPSLIPAEKKKAFHQKINEILNKLSERATTPSLIPAEKKKAFQKPTVVEIYDYACERLSNEDALKFTEKFHAHYEANGWKVGRNAMKDWKAAVRKWDLSTFDTSKTNQSNQNKIKNGKFDSDAAQRIYADAHNYTKD